MNKRKLIGTVGGIIGGILVLLGFVWFKNTAIFLSLFFTGGVMAIVSILIYSSGKQEKEQEKREAEKEETFKRSQEAVASHRGDSAIHEIIYECGRPYSGPLADLIRRSSYTVESGYYEKADAFYLLIARFDLGVLKNRIDFLLRLITGKETFLTVNDREIDISELSKAEILEKIKETLEKDISEKEKSTLDFKVKYPKSIFYVMAGMLTLSTAALITLLVLLAVHILPQDLWPFFGVAGFFMLLSGLGVWECVRESFSLKEGVYTYRGFFKTQSCNARDVAKITITQSALGAVTYVAFIGKDGETLMKCADDGMMWRLGDFKRSLNHYGIEIK